MSFSAQQSYTGSVTAAASGPITFGYASNNTPIRYSYFAVNNTGGTVLYVRTDGTAATNGGDFCTAVQPGQTVTVANALPLWTQSATVIPAGYDQGSSPSAGQPGYPGTPAGPTPAGGSYAGGSLYGQTANPGSSVSVYSSGTAVTFTVSGTG